MKNTNWFLVKEAVLSSVNVSTEDKAFIMSGFYTPNNTCINALLKEHQEFLNFRFKDFEEILEYGDAYLYGKEGSTILTSHPLFLGGCGDSSSRLHMEKLFTLLYNTGWWCSGSDRWKSFVEGTPINIK